jgi:type I restriction-modification system DNA methylase subunit
MLNDEFVSSANQILADMQKVPSLEKGLELSKLILTQISKSAKDSDLSFVKDRCVVDVVGIGNTKMESWFKPHPYLGGHLSAFDLFVNQNSILEAKFYHLNENATKRIVAGSVQLLPNWEDHALLTRNSDWKVGIDFFLSSDSKSLLFVLSLEGNLRILELTERISNTQAQIIEKLSGAGDLATHEAIHSVLWNALAIREVNKEFYAGVSEMFEELRIFFINNGKNDEDSKIFSSRLIGRLLFLWFLRRKKIVVDARYFDCEGISSSEYYEVRLKPLFFEVLANPVEERTKSKDTDTPYLNGGLFEAHENDWIGEKLKFPTGFFDRIYSHFNKFNFTTDESSPDYEQVAIDPEMLGRVFESLLATQLTESGESARKAMGAYYTPREVVTFMCRESVRQYLYKQLNNPSWNSGIDRLIDASDATVAKAHSNFLRDLWGSENAKVVIPKTLEAIYAIKVVDPACGSGAFPLGMVQTLQRLVERLDQKAKPHEIKMKIIRNCIFGVDIEPMAIEIAKLRTWLSLAVEVSDIENIEPLPNLDFKYICANSLVPLADLHDGIDFGIDPQLSKKLSEIRDLYFNTSSRKEKYQFRDQYYKLTKRDFSTDIDLRSKQLRSFDPFGFSSASEFFDPEQMFGLQKFDIVIGNPPYVSVKGISKEDKQRFQEIFESGKGRFNLFTLFIEFGIKILSKDSILSFIIPDGLFSHTEYRHIRRFIVENGSVLLAVLFSEKVFDAAVDTAIVQIKRGKSDEKGEVRRDLNRLVGEFHQKELQIPEEFIFPVQVATEDKKLIEKIQISGNGERSLKREFDLQQGIIYSGKTKKEVFAETAKTKKYKPSLDGRDVLPFLVNWKAKQENRFIKYSNELHRPRDESLFLAPKKIVMPRKSTKLVCAVDEEQFYALNTAYVLVPKSSKCDIYFYAGLLNSRLISYYYKSIFFGWQVTIPALSSLPICMRDASLVASISKASKEAHLKAKKGLDILEIKEEIDLLVYQLYGITNDEIAIINNSLIGHL